MSPSGFRHDREFILAKGGKENEQILRLGSFPEMLKVQPRIDLKKNQMHLNVENEEIGLKLECKNKSGTSPFLEKTICGKK